MTGLPPSRGKALQIMSDLHLETPRFLPLYSTFQVEPNARYLALLGDIGNIHDPRLFTFIDSVLEQYELVFYVLGNHEPYANEDSQDSEDLPLEEAVNRMREFERRLEHQRQECEASHIGRFILMDRRRFDINNTTRLLGCTLFSHITPDQESTASLFVSDFANIPQWNTRSHNAAHARDLAWLNDQVSRISSHEPHRQIVILAHYSPTKQLEANNPDHLEDSRGVQSAFVTDLTGEICWMDASVKVWAFGHTHWNCDFVDKTTKKRVMANQRGYGREDVFDFDPRKIIVIPQGPLG